MISTLLAGDWRFWQGAIVVGMLLLAGLAALLHRRGGRARRILVVGLVLSGLAVAALTLIPQGGSPAAQFCWVEAPARFEAANGLLVFPLVYLAVLLLGRPLLLGVAGSALSAAIELTQALIPALGRSCDTSDWLLNTVGAALGALLGWVVIRIVPASGRRGATTPRLD